MDKELVALSLLQIQEMAALKTSYDAHVRSILSNQPEGADGDKEVIFAFEPDSVRIVEPTLDGCVTIAAKLLTQD